MNKYTYETYSAKPTEIERSWLLIDAENAVVGRLAAEIAILLRGKHKPIFTPHVDCGDYVVIVNAAQVVFTGRKLSEKKYHRHSNYPGGLKQTTAEKVLDGKKPERVLQDAVRRMLPSGKLGRQQLSKLKVYPWSKHPHEAQDPQYYDFASKNPKNTLGYKNMSGHNKIKEHIDDAVERSRADIISAMSGQHQESMTQISSMNDRMAGFEQNLTDLSTNISALTKSIDGLRGEFKDLSSSLPKMVEEQIRSNKSEQQTMEEIRDLLASMASKNSPGL